MVNQRFFLKYKVIIICLLILGIIALYLLNVKGNYQYPDLSISPTQAFFTPTLAISSAKNKVFTGTVKTGSQLGEQKSYCPEGLYLLADQGTYLTGQTTTLQLQASPDKADLNTSSLKNFIGKRVKVSGKYPAQEVFCEALICQCDDYILVESIDVTDIQ
ncbi:hypothetical protein HY357_02865 [Candidatus Roizmanbacteria bacterium]|nr:hypothetical protein [Candidatus Roizmanbacteria bacterium]